ncbi:hypothetical protein T492DRAFT_897389 [Pavlovales sp. CCMP2436]|nr:hypothetical protein T492DRAFT_897419 [Pavlovales sp. CCMP2436]KAJ1615601.1 hypothetical protein T492DRAFT_897389 [Pavlovales sp. CCMP2436]
MTLNQTPGREARLAHDFRFSPRSLAPMGPSAVPTGITTGITAGSRGAPPGLLLDSHSLNDSVRSNNGSGARTAAELEEGVRASEYSFSSQVRRRSITPDAFGIWATAVASSAEVLLPFGLGGVHCNFSLLIVTDVGPDPDDAKALLIAATLHQQKLITLRGVITNGGHQGTRRAG